MKYAALNVVVVADKADIDGAVEAHRAWLINSTTPNPPSPLWVAGTCEEGQDGMMVLDLHKLAPEVRYLAVFVDPVNTENLRLDLRRSINE